MTIHFIYASGSGHTEYVVRAVIEKFKELDASLECEMQMAEEAQAEDLSRGDILVLCSGTWNTGGVEGQMHPYMYELVKKKAVEVDLADKKCTCIALGDERYYYTARAGEHMRKYLIDHNGDWACDALTIINEPYGQEERIYKWCEKFLSKISG